MNIKPKFKEADLIKMLNNAGFKHSDIQFKPVAEGIESQVCEVIVNKKSYIIRVNSCDNGFLKDNYAYNKIKSSEISVPEIYYIGDYQEFYFCISQYIKGHTVQDVNSSALKNLSSKIDALWQNIYQTDIGHTKGYGPLDLSGNGVFDSWENYLYDLLRQFESQRSDFKVEIDEGLYDELLKAFKALIDSCPEDRFLYHGDFGANNLITDGTYLMGVIDWDCCGYGDPLIDVAGSYFWNFSLECMRTQAQYWDSVLPSKFDNFYQRIYCYQLMIALSDISENAIKGDQTIVKWLEDRSRHLLLKITS